MSEQENIHIVRELFDGLNAHDLDIGDKHFADENLSMAPGAPAPLDRERFKEYLRGYIQAFPDLRVEPREIIADGDKVAVTWVSTGTHTGSLVSASGMTVPATNRKIRNTGTSVFEFRNGKVIRQDLYFDQVELLNQLGVMETIQRR
jgi:steroid delta-isomerase-like uncharacterized protein